MTESEYTAVLNQDRLNRAVDLLSSVSANEEEIKKVKQILNKVWREDIQPNLPTIEY